MVEVHHVIVQRVRGDDQVADVLSIQRHLELERVLHRPDGRNGVNRRAHAADALGEEPGFARIAPFEDQLDAAPHLSRGPGVPHLAVLDLDVDPEVALDAGDGIDRDSLAHDYTFAGAAMIGKRRERRTKTQNAMDQRLSATVISPSEGKYDH